MKEKGTCIRTMIDERISKISSLIDDNYLMENIDLAVSIICDTIKRGGKVMCIGNGGSASQAQHLCAEMMGRMKEPRMPFKFIFLGGDISTTTCIANDFGYERIFSRQIEGLGDENDCVIAFTTSGKSRNILEALAVSSSLKIKIIVLTGGNRIDLERISDCVVSIKNNDTCIQQELEMMIIHIICSLIEKRTKDMFHISLWEKVLELSDCGYKYLLLDRDGIINKVKANGYITKWNEFVFVDSFIRNIQELSKTFQYIFVVTNQKGVSKGLLTEEELKNIHTHMINEIKLNGGEITNVYVSLGDDYNRKPNIGMAKQIMADYPEVDFNRAIMVGDSMADMLFAKNIGARYIYGGTN